MIIKIYNKYESKTRFADLFNGSIFRGKEVIKEEELSELDSVLIMEKNDQNRRKTKIIADKSYLWRGICTSVMILESQSYIDYGIVLRVIKDEVAAYDKQRRQGLEKWKKENKDSESFLSSMYHGQTLFPVLTLVLYIGTEDAHLMARELYGLLEIEEGLKPFINNYKINLYDYHDENDFSVFKTENRLFFELLKASGSKGKMMEILKNHTYCKDIEVLKMIINSIGIKMDIDKIQRNEKGEYEMCKAIEDWERDLINEGYHRGISQGILQGKEMMLKNSIKSVMKNKKMSQKEALDLLGVSEEDRKLFYMML